MSKMTREERLAAGWVECWGARVCTTPQCWWTGHQANGGHSWVDNPKAGEREDFGSSELAATFVMACGIGGCAPNVRACPFWRRRKPKAPPPLKVGDEVTVRAKVVQVHYDTPCPQVRVNVFGCPAGQPSFWIYPKQAAKE